MNTKDSLSMKLFRIIKKLQKQLDNNVKKYGVQDVKSKEIGAKIDDLTNEYYSSINMIHFPVKNTTTKFYNTSYTKLKEITKENQKFPTTEEWNKLAMKENLFSSISMQYISELDWNYLRAKVEREVNIERALGQGRLFYLER